MSDAPSWLTDDNTADVAEAAAKNPHVQKAAISAAKNPQVQQAAFKHAVGNTPSWSDEHTNPQGDDYTNAYDEEEGEVSIYFHFLFSPLLCFIMIKFYYFNIILTINIIFPYFLCSFL